MSRVHIPGEFSDVALLYVKKNYATDIIEAAQGLSKATYQKTRLTLREFEGARARTAQINGCKLCQSWRSIENLKVYFKNFGGIYEESVASHGPVPDETYYESVADWRTSPVYSDRERIAIEYAERLGLEPKVVAADEDFWVRMKALYNDDELVDLSYCIAVWMGVGRAVHALGLDAPVCAMIPDELMREAREAA